MAYVPFVTLVVVEQFAARQEEESPVHVPLGAVLSSVRLVENRRHFSSFVVCVQFLQPVLARARVMFAIYPPLSL